MAKNTEFCYNLLMDANNISRMFIHAAEIASPILSGLGLGHKDDTPSGWTDDGPSTM